MSGDATRIDAPPLTPGTLRRLRRQALRRRGCAALAWAPLVIHGELVGALELSDAGDRDFSRHAELLDGVSGQTDA